MTADPRSSVLYKPSWVPREHTAGAPVGVAFDAVRVRGQLAALVAGVLGTSAGPIVQNRYDDEMHFLVPPGSTDGMRWPAGVVVFNAAHSEPVMVPALWGNTYPLEWKSPPLQDAHFVDVGALRSALRELTTWKQLSAPGR